MDYKTTCCTVFTLIRVIKVPRLAPVFNCLLISEMATEVVNENMWVFSEMGRIHKSDPFSLVIVNNYVSVFGHTGRRWRQKYSIKTAARAHKLPFIAIEKMKVSGFQFNTGTCIHCDGELDGYRLYCPDIPAHLKGEKLPRVHYNRRAEEVVCMRPMDVQRLILLNGKSTGKALMDKILNDLNNGVYQLNFGGEMEGSQVHDGKGDLLSMAISLANLN